MCWRSPTASSLMLESSGGSCWHLAWIDTGRASEFRSVCGATLTRASKHGPRHQHVLSLAATGGPYDTDGKGYVAWARVHQKCNVCVCVCVCASCCPFRCVFTKRCFTCTVASRCVLHLTEPFSLTPFPLPLYVSLCVEHRLCELRAARGCALVRATGRPFRVRDCFLDDILAASPCAPATRNAEELGMGYVQHAAEDGRKTSRYDFWKESPTSGRKMLLPCESLRGQGWKGPVRETASDACRKILQVQFVQLF